MWPLGTNQNPVGPLSVGRVPKNPIFLRRIYYAITEIAYLPSFAWAMAGTPWNESFAYGGHGGTCVDCLLRAGRTVWQSRLRPPCCKPKDRTAVVMRTVLCLHLFSLPCHLYRFSFQHCHIVVSSSILRVFLLLACLLLFLFSLLLLLLLLPHLCSAT